MSIFNFMAQGIHEMADQAQRSKDRKQNQAQFEQQMNLANQQMDLANEQLDWNKKVAQQNFMLQQNQFDYQKQLNDTQMQREDTAYQRQIADLKAAGFSPLMASGGASSSPLSSANAPQLDVTGTNQGYSSAQNAYSSKMDAYRRYQEQRNFERQMEFDKWQSRKQTLLQTAGLAQQVASAYYDNQLKRENIKSKRYENDFYEEHGYRQISLATVLSDFLQRDSTKKAMESIANMGDKFTSAVSDIVDSLNGKGDKVIYTNIPDFKSALKAQGLNDEEQQILIDAVEAEAKAPLHRIAIRDLDGILNRVYWALAEKFHKKK